MREQGLDVAEHDARLLPIASHAHHDAPFARPEHSTVVATGREIGSDECCHRALTAAPTRDHPRFPRRHDRGHVAPRELAERCQLLVVERQREQRLEERPPARPARPLEVAERRGEVHDRAPQRLARARLPPAGLCALLAERARPLVGTEQRGRTHDDRCRRAASTLSASCGPVDVGTAFRGRSARRIRGRCGVPAFRRRFAATMCCSAL